MLLVPSTEIENATIIPNQQINLRTTGNTGTFWGCKFKLAELLQDFFFSDLYRLGNSLYQYRFVLGILRVYGIPFLFSLCCLGSLGNVRQGTVESSGWPDTFETKNAMFPWICAGLACCRWRLGPPKKVVSARSQGYGLWIYYPSLSLYPVHFTSNANNANRETHASLSALKMLVRKLLNECIIPPPPPHHHQHHHHRTVSGWIVSRRKWRQ